MDIGVAVHDEAFVDSLVVKVNFAYGQRVFRYLMSTVFEDFGLIPEPYLSQVVFAFCFALEFNFTADVCLEVSMGVF